MQKTKPIYKPQRNANQRCQQQRVYKQFNFTISPILHEQLVLSILNYQSMQKQEQAFFTMENFIRDLHSDYYEYCQPENDENVYPTHKRKPYSIEQINLQYGENMQQNDTKMIHRPQRVSFSDESSVKYYKKDDPPSGISKYEEFCQSTFDQNDQLLRFNL